MPKILVTGGAGFIGCNFVRERLSRNPSDTMLVFDSLTYAGNLENLDGLDKKYSGYSFMRGDICDPKAVEAAWKALGQVDWVIHFAAESHVDRSIESAGEFVRTNVLGTQVLLEAAQRHGVGKFVHVSTDEVYGSLGPDDPAFTEQNQIEPNSPYSASKAGSDCLARAYFHTHKLPVVITRCSNNYGPYQFPEKFIPLFITNAMEGRALPLYGDGKNVRDWVHVWDHNRAVEQVAEKGRPGEVYNIGGNCERSNVDIAKLICKLVGKSDSLIQFVKDRPGHDRRYAMNCQKLEKELGWKAGPQIEEQLPALVDWYRSQRPWWDNIKSGAYRGYYERMYKDRLASQ